MSSPTLIDEELLAAYVDGELDAQTRAAIEHAVSGDAALGERLARQRQLRTQLRTAFDGVLHEPVPTDLLQSLSQAGATRSEVPATRAAVIDLARARAARQQPDAQSPGTTQRGRRWMAAIAACAIVGLCAALLTQRLGGGDPNTVYRDGALLARGALAGALEEQLTGASAKAPGLQLGLSFRARGGNYCRTFLIKERHSMAGLACREGGDWRLATQVSLDSPIDPAAAGSDYRMAASPLPAAIAAAVSERIVGEPLDAAAEIAAQRRGWQ